MTEHDPHDPYKLYTRMEAAEFLRITPAWLTELSKTGAIYCVASGRRKLYPRAALTAYIRGEKLSSVDLDSDDLTTWPPTPSIFGVTE